MGGQDAFCIPRALGSEEGRKLLDPDDVGRSKALAAPPEVTGNGHQGGQWLPVTLSVMCDPAAPKAPGVAAVVTLVPAACLSPSGLEEVGKLEVTQP